MYIDREEYIKHINDPIDKITIRRILDKIEQTLQKHTIESTNFLNPHEIYLAKSVLNRFSDLNYLISGGYEKAERKIITIYPEYYFEDDIDIAVSPLKISGEIKHLTHKDYLGSVLSLGLERDKIGDILIYKEYSIVMVKKELENYIIFNLNKIKNINVKTSISAIEEIKAPEMKYKESIEFLLSLRLDSIISATFNLSRKESFKIIKREDVKVNFELIDKPSREIQIGDLISVRGFGRFILYDIKGKSKGDRFICIVRTIL